MSLLYIGVNGVRLPGGTRYSTPAGLTTDLPAILTLAAETGADTTVLDHSPVNGGAAELVAAINALGWTQVSTTTERGWLTIIHANVRANLAVRAWCPDDPMLDDPDTLVGRMLLWQNRFIEPYRMTPGVSLLATMNGMLGGHNVRRRLQHAATAEWWKPPTQIGDLRWSTKDTHPGELHRWDMRSAYLAAAAAVSLPPTPLQHQGPHNGTDPTEVGYYRIRITAGPTAGLGKPDRQGCLWVCHPTLDLLRDNRSWQYEIIDSWAMPAGGRLLRPWAERVRDAITEVPIEEFRRIVKQGYAQAIGLLNVPRGAMYRPDWRHMIIDQTRASMIRRIASVRRLVGIDPVRIDVDSVWYATADPDHVGAALGEGPNIGRMRYEGAGIFEGRRWIPQEVAV